MYSITKSNELRHPLLYLDLKKAFFYQIYHFRKNELSQNTAIFSLLCIQNLIYSRENRVLFYDIFCGNNNFLESSALPLSGLWENYGLWVFLLQFYNLFHTCEFRLDYKRESFRISSLLCEGVVWTIIKRVRLPIFGCQFIRF